MVVNIHAPYPPMRNMADKVIEAVKSGAVRHFFLVGGCGGTRPGRSCCMQFVKQTPADTVVLILACGKFLFNDLDLGTVSRSDRTNYVMCCMACSLCSILPPSRTTNVLTTSFIAWQRINTFTFMAAYPSLRVLSQRHRCPGDQNDRQNCASKRRSSDDCHCLFAEFPLRRHADQRGASHADSRSNKSDAQRFP